MKKKIIKCISVIMTIITAFSVILLVLMFINPSSGGFIDLTNVVRYFLAAVGIISGLLAFITGHFGWKE